MSESPLKDLRILVIDGGGGSGDELRTALAAVGAAAVRVSAERDQALTHLADERFDLVLGRMDGSAFDFEGFARALREARRSPSQETPILLIAGAPVRSELQSALAAGVTGFLVGGLTPERLRGQILRMLRAYGPF